MNTTANPFFEELDRAACEALLARNHVGRIAYCRANRVDVEPVNYVYSEGWIYGRTSLGRKLEMTGFSWWPVAFQVDEVTNMFRWKSVVVHGGFYTIPSDGTEWEAEAWARGVQLLRKLIPETFREDDPVPFRDILFRIAVQDVQGRAAVPAIDAPARKSSAPEAEEPADSAEPVKPPPLADV